MSLRAATVAAPMRKLWLEKLPSICAVEKICHSQSVKIERDRGWPFARRNKGPVTFPRTERYASNAWTAQRGALPKPIWMWQPWRNGSVFDAFILTRRHVGDWRESTAMSATERWIAGEKLAKLGTVNQQHGENQNNPAGRLPKRRNDRKTWGPTPDEWPREGCQ